MSNVLLSRCFLMVCHMFHCCSLLSMIHPPDVISWALMPMTLLRLRRPCLSTWLYYHVLWCAWCPVYAHTVELSMRDHGRALTAEGWLVYTEHPCQCKDGSLELYVLKIVHGSIRYNAPI